MLRMIAMALGQSQALLLYEQTYFLHARAYKTALNNSHQNFSNLQVTIKSLVFRLQADLICVVPHRVQLKFPTDSKQIRMPGATNVESQPFCWHWKRQRVCAPYTKPFLETEILSAVNNCDHLRTALSKVRSNGAENKTKVGLFLSIPNNLTFTKSFQTIWALKIDARRRDEKHKLCIFVTRKAAHALAMTGKMGVTSRDIEPTHQRLLK